MHPSLAALAASQGGVFTHAQALVAGYTARQIKHRVASRQWVRLRRGVFAEAAVHEAASHEPRSLHLLRAAAGVAVTGRDVWLSHRSAAWAWRVPLVGRSPSDVALTVAHQHRRRSPGVEFHTAATPLPHRAVADGLPVTSVARTVSDLARSLPFAHAVVAADASLHQGLCTASELTAVVADCPVWPGIARTKRVLEFADLRSESPGESLSRVAMAAVGLPSPELQVELLLGGRRMRVDFMWPAYRLVGEFDGRVKYGTTEALWAEKQREDLIRRHNYGVVRWIWSDVYPDPTPMAALIRSAMRS